MSRLEPTGDTAPSLSSELLEMLLDVMPDAAVVVDGTGDIMAVNRLAERLFDFRGVDLVGEKIETLVPERFRHVHRGHRTAYSARPVVRAMGAGLRLAGRRRDGSEFPVDISLAAIGGPDRNLVVAAIRDRTEQDRSVADLAQLAAIISSSTDAIFSVTPDGKVTTWNPGAGQLLGIEPEEMIGHHVSRVFPEDGSPEFQELLAGVIAQENTGPRDTVWVTKSGRPIDVAVSLSPLRERDGRLLGISVMARDIIQRKRAEAALRRQERVQALTADVRLSMLSNSPLDETFDLVCGRLAKLLDAEGTLIAVLKDGDLTVAAAAGAFAPNAGLRFDEVPYFLKDVLETGVSRVVALGESGLGAQLMSQRPREDEILLVAPLQSDRGPLGVLLSVGRPEQLGTREIPTVEGLAGAAALAIELAVARQAREHLLLIGDRERIARDLHDLVIQRLFGTGMVLEGVLGLITNARAAERVAGAVDDLDATIREIRTTIFALETPKAAETGLRAEILRVVAAMSEQLGFEPNVHFDGPVDSAINDVVKAELVAVVREALSNVARHAKATRADVDLRVDTMVVLVVSDDGTGIGAAKRESGLANLRYRAEKLDGVMEIGQVASGGTQLEWRVPVRR